MVRILIIKKYVNDIPITALEPASLWATSYKVVAKEIAWISHAYDRLFLLA